MIDSPNPTEERLRKKYVLVFSPRSVFIFLASIALAFIMLSIFGRFLMWHVPQSYTKLWRLIPMFDVNLEYNFPAFYSSMLLLMSAVLLAYISFAIRSWQGKYYLHWLGLAGIFLFLALDEMLAIHEIFTDPMRSKLNADGFFYYTWVIPYALFVIAVGLVYIRFLRHLPKRIRNIFILSGALYIGGALVLEMAVGYIVRADLGSDTLVYMMATTEEHIEELLEMLGVSLFIYALLLYIRMKLKRVTIQLISSDV